MITKAKLPRFQFQFQLLGSVLRAPLVMKPACLERMQESFVAIELQNSYESLCQNLHSNFQTAAALSL